MDSPRPSSSSLALANALNGEDDGVYRSIFQQPVLDIPPTAPSYTWFEFLLHPQALQQHLETLRQQKAQGTYQATSAIELVREFLDQAQLVADEGNTQNNRYNALLVIAAQVALEMEFSMELIESSLPLAFQRLLVDGIVDYTLSQASTTTASGSASTTTKWSAVEAQVFHHRWLLRAFVSQEQSNFLTCTSKNEAEESSLDFQLALKHSESLADKSPHQIAIDLQELLRQILTSASVPSASPTSSSRSSGSPTPSPCSSVETAPDAPVTIMQDRLAIEKATCMDLGKFFFSFKEYDRAYEFLNRALEIALENENKDGQQQPSDASDESSSSRRPMLGLGKGKLSANQQEQEQRQQLEGFVAACEAILERKALCENEKLPEDAIQEALEMKDWEYVVTALERDLLDAFFTTTAATTCGSLTGTQVKLLSAAKRTQIQQFVNYQLHKPNAGKERDRLRGFAKQIELINAFYDLLGSDINRPIALERCVCTCLQLFQEQLVALTSKRPHHHHRHHHHHHHREANDPPSCFQMLAEFLVRLIHSLEKNASTGATDSDDSEDVDPGRDVDGQRLLEDQQSLMRDRLKSVQLVNQKLRASCPMLFDVEEQQKTLDRVKFVKRDMDFQKRSHLVASDLNRLYKFHSFDEKTQLHEFLLQWDVRKRPQEQQTGRDIAEGQLVGFCMVNGWWDVLEKWEQKLTSSNSSGDSGDNNDEKNEDSVVSNSLFTRRVQVATACGDLVQYLASKPKGDSKAGSTSGPFSEKNNNKQPMEWVIGKSNALLHGLMSKIRAFFDVQRAQAQQTLNDDDLWRNLLMSLPLWMLETMIAMTAGLLYRASVRNLCEYRVTFELNPYGDLAFAQVFAPENSFPPNSNAMEVDSGEAPSNSSSPVKPMTTATLLTKEFLAELVALHLMILKCLSIRSPREPRWHCAQADLALNPIIHQKLPLKIDPYESLRGYLVAASLATNFFAEGTSAVDIIDQSSLVRLSHCLVKVGAHVAAAVLYQYFAPEEMKYGLRILQLAPETHDDHFFQYFWTLPFLELLVHLHSTPKHFNQSYVTLLTHLIQSPELNSSNPPHVLKELENRLIRCYFRDLCQLFLPRK